MVRSESFGNFGFRVVLCAALCPSHQRGTSRRSLEVRRTRLPRPSDRPRHPPASGPPISCEHSQQVGERQGARLERKVAEPGTPPGPPQFLGPSGSREPRSSGTEIGTPCPQEHRPGPRPSFQSTAPRPSGMSIRILARKGCELEGSGFFARAESRHGRLRWQIMTKGTEVLPVRLTLIRYASEGRGTDSSADASTAPWAKVFEVSYRRNPSPDGRLGRPQVWCRGKGVP